MNSSEQNLTGTDPRIAALRAKGWVGQTELGIILELSSQRVGKLLDGLGLREGRAGTAYAESIGAASEHVRGQDKKEGDYVYSLWRPEVVIPLIRAVL